jgi:hypothetical protein
MELTGSEEKSVLTLEVTAQGPILRGTATIQGVGEFQVEGRVLTRGVELVLRGEPFSLRLTGVQREKTLRGTYNIPSQKRSGPFQLQER